MNKRGISSVVAAVLIILLVVVAVGLVWIALIPMIDENYAFDEDIDVSIIVAEGYTVYDPVRMFGFVQIKRGGDNQSIGRIKIIFTIEGNSVTYETKTIPEPNGNKVYSFNFSRDGITGIPDFVSVVPIFIINNHDKEGDVTSKVKMPILSAQVTFEDDEESEENRPSSEGDSGVGKSRYVDISSCPGEDMESDKIYTLQQNIVASELCFGLINIRDTTIDLNGFSISGPADDYAFGMDNSSRIVVKNGGILGAGGGIMMFDNSSNNFISNVEVLNGKKYGIYMDPTSGFNDVVSSSFSNIRSEINFYQIYGMYIRSNDNYFNDLEVINNSAGGIESHVWGILFYGGLRNYLENIRSTENHVDGIDAKGAGLYLHSANYSTFVNINTSHNYCTSNCDPYTVDGGSSAGGIGIVYSHSNNFTNIESTHSFHSGIYVYPNSYGNSFNNIQASDNGNFGITLHNAWDNNLSNVVVNNMVRGVYIVNFQNAFNDNNRLFNVTGLDNENGLYFQRLSSSIAVTNTKVIDSRFCGSSVSDVYCATYATGTSGSGNVFGGSVANCADNGWPVLNTDYISGC